MCVNSQVSSFISIMVRKKPNQSSGKQPAPKKRGRKKDPEPPASDEASEHGEDAPDTEAQEQVSDVDKTPPGDSQPEGSKTKQVKKKEEQADVMVDWMQANPGLYNKSKNAFRNKNAKTLLWNDKAAELNCMVTQLTSEVGGHLVHKVWQADERQSIWCWCQGSHRQGRVDH